MGARKKAAARKKKAAARKPRGYRPRRYSGKDRTRAARLVQRLQEDYPDAECALQHRGAYELLAATILSAQCTDLRVNVVTPELFYRWPTPAGLARAPQAELEDVIRSTGFFRNKAKNLIGMARRLTEAYGGDGFERALETQLRDEKALEFLVARAKVEETTDT